MKKNAMKGLGDASSTSHDLDRARAQRDALDIEIINLNSDQLNADAEDSLRYQAFGSFDESNESPSVKKKSRKR